MKSPHGFRIGAILAVLLTLEQSHFVGSFTCIEHSSTKYHTGLRLLPAQQSKSEKFQRTTRKRDRRSNVKAISIRSSSGENDIPIDSDRMIVRIPIQIFVVLACYVLHLGYLSQKQVVFPFQLIPNSMGHCTGIGLDSLAGIVSMASYSYLVRRQRSNPKGNEKPKTVLAPILSSPKENETPWRLPEGNARNRLTGVITGFLLVQTYFVTGRFSLFWEDTLYSMSGLGFPITAPMYRSLTVLFGHLTWLTAGTLLLRWIPRPPRFFSNNNKALFQDDNTPINDSKFRWFRSTVYANWLWWVIGGYFASSCLFNLADLANQYCLPAQVLDDAQESLVSQLVNPEHNDFLASAVGYIAPCITAPWWEEVLYRGFALPLLTKLFGYHWAVFLQGVIFSAHHMSLTAALPLAILGWIWAIIYTKSQNLWVVVFIHSLWNSRVFLGSWLGL